MERKGRPRHDREMEERKIGNKFVREFVERENVKRVELKEFYNGLCAQSDENRKMLKTLVNENDVMKHFIASLERSSKDKDERYFKLMSEVDQIEKELISLKNKTAQVPLTVDQLTAEQRRVEELINREEEKRLRFKEQVCSKTNVFLGQSKVKLAESIRSDPKCAELYDKLKSVNERLSSIRSVAVQPVPEQSASEERVEVIVQKSMSKIEQLSKRMDCMSIKSVSNASNFDSESEASSFDFSKISGSVVM